MTQASTGAGRPATSRPIFVRITIGLLVLLVLCGAVIALLLAQNSGDGGYSWLLVGFISRPLWLSALRARYSRSFRY